MAPKSEREKNQNIQVVVRCRPLNTTERKQGSYSIVEVCQDRHEVHVRERNVPMAQPRCFTFDKVFGPRAEQIEVYKTVMTPMIEEVLQGYNCTVFAYGQTGTGKTFTMNGDRSADESLTWENDPLVGIIPRAMHQLFTHLQSQEEEVEFSVRVSYLEIYNEELVDLLGAETVDNPRLKIYEDTTKRGSCVIHGLEEIIVHSKDEVYNILEQGSRRRQTAATLMNAQSSRSHSLFMLTVHIKENNIAGEEMLKIGKLNLVDLAGSECIGRSGATERRAREAGQINQSLLTLGRVITALVDHAPHVPYRESKLTRLLQDSLGGRTKTSIIATISPALINLDETMSTLNYANTAKCIQNRPEVNARLTKRAMLKGYEEEIERLRRDLQAARDKNGVYIASENYEAMQGEIIQKTAFIKELEEQLEFITAEKEKLEEVFEETKQHLTETRQKLSVTVKNLKTTRQDRDEQKFLVKEHVTTEEKLYGDAEHLLSTAELSTDHVGRLHDKIDRNSSVEQHNEQATITYESKLHTNVDEMRKSLESFTKEQKSMSTQIKNKLEELMIRRNTELCDQEKEMTSLATTVTEKLNKLKSEQQQHLTLSMHNTEQLSDKVETFKADEVCHQFDFHEQTFLACVEVLHNRQASQVSNLKELQNNLKQQFELQQAMVERYVVDITGKTEGLQKFIDEFVEDHNEKLDKNIKTTEQISVEQVELNQTMTDLVSKLSNTLQTQKSKLDALTQLKSGQLQNQQSLSTFHKDGKVKTRTHIKLHSELRCNYSDLNNSHHQERDRHLQKLIDDETMTTGINDMKDKMAAFSQTSQQNILNHCKDASEIIEQHKEHLKSANIQTEQVMDLSRYAPKTITDIQSKHRDQHEAMNQDMSSQANDLSLLNSKMTEWSDMHQQCIDNIEKDNIHYTNVELKKTIPTGLTPQRQDYSYPRTLTKTDRHSLLLKNFREEYHLEEALKVPIPYDSFSDSENESKAPTTNSCNEITDDSDCHSLTSNGSALSSIYSKDGVGKENTKATMKAPAGRAPVANKSQRAAKMALTITPDNKHIDNSKGNKLVAGNSAPKSRTRLPLRSKSPN